MFRPERWLDSSPEKIREQEKTLEIVFAFGKYQCLGRNVALMEMNKVFVEVSREIFPAEYQNADLFEAFSAI